MLVTLLTEKYYMSEELPQKITGQYYIGEFQIEGVDGQWVLKVNKAYLDSINGTKRVILSENQMLNFVNQSTKEKLCIYVENETLDRQQFIKKTVKGTRIKLSIGRGSQNNISIDNNYISNNHACLTYNDGQWKIADNNSTNGTYVNQRRIEKKILKYGDVVFIMGVKIILGRDFLAYNNPDKNVKLSSTDLLDFEMQKKNSGFDEYEIPKQKYFYRSPRFKRDITTALFKVDSPPQSVVGEELPLMLVIGPSMTMGLASMTTGIFAVNNALSSGNISAAVPSVVMSMSMMLGTVLWPIMTKKYEKKHKLIKEEKRQKLYHEYLTQVKEQFATESDNQAKIINENSISIDECIKRIKNVERNLWERGIGQSDFLSLRVGVGSILLDADISYSERKFTMENDNLQEELYALCEEPKIIHDVPINISLFENFISGVIGDKNATREFAVGLIFQIAALYGYDELKLVFIYDENKEDEYGFVKWLPHVWDDEHKFRFMATNNSEVKELSSYFEKMIENRTQIPENEMEDMVPYYVVFALDKELCIKAEVLKKIYGNKTNLHMSVITFFDELKNIPKECTNVVEIEKNKDTGKYEGKIFDKDDISGQSTRFVPDIFVSEDNRELSIALSNVMLDISSGRYNLPNMVTFLEMYGVGKVEHLNSIMRWKENDPTKSLSAPIGIDTFGDVFMLDLHEKFHGPHGLIAGMTGSGKSEFIISYILSLAVNYHPYEVAFVLIDYKGGGMAKAFEDLPHTAGIITNLDGTSVKRSLLSIESELIRRQSIFAKVSKEVGVSNVDIYKYQKLYREGKVSEPLQHLFIISDEFAELKTQQPEFMAQLVSAARIGRSLGIHLILATQKPSGVVDDQIWSNSRFRVCLKVQERSDSMDMLKRPDAAELAQTGRFYLQVGYNEMFELGQSAWAGAGYFPSESVVTEKDDGVDVIDKNGRIIKQAKLDKKSILFTKQNKQLDEITSYLKKIAEDENIKVRRLWLDPIPAVIYLSDIKNKYNCSSEKYLLNPVIGEYDDPVNQSQNVLRLPISEQGNAIIYGTAGSGKTTFLTTMIYSLMKEHTPEEVNVYILDFASETLTTFEKAPIVGDVVLSFEEEKISNLFKMLHKEILRRKKIFASYGGDYKSYIKNSDSKMPEIIVAVNNFAAFLEMYAEKEEAIAYLSREGTKYGMYFILTATGTNAVRYKLLQNFHQLLALQLNDEMDYATVVGKTDGLYPAKHKGRGLIKIDNIYEFQIANVCDGTNTMDFIMSECNRISAEWNGNVAKRIPILPQFVDHEFIGKYVHENDLNVPIGVDSQSLEVFYYSFAEKYITFVLSSNDTHLKFAFDLSTVFQKDIGVETTLIDMSKKYIGFDSNIKYVYKPNDVLELIRNLYNTVLERNNQYKEALTRNETVGAFEQKVVVINDISSLRAFVEEYEQEKQMLELILEKGESTYNVTIIIAETIKNVSSFTFEKWYKKHITQSDCIWIGSGISEQYYFKANKSTPEMHDDIGNKFGFALVNGKANKIKILSITEEEE